MQWVNTLMPTCKCTPAKTNIQIWMHTDTQTLVGVLLLSNCHNARESSEFFLAVQCPSKLKRIFQKYTGKIESPSLPKQNAHKAPGPCTQVQVHTSCVPPASIADASTPCIFIGPLTSRDVWSSHFHSLYLYLSPAIWILPRIQN